MVKCAANESASGCHFGTRGGERLLIRLRNRAVRYRVSKSAKKNSEVNEDNRRQAMRFYGQGMPLEVSSGKLSSLGRDKVAFQFELLQVQV